MPNASNSNTNNSNTNNSVNPNAAQNASIQQSGMQGQPSSEPDIQKQQEKESSKKALATAAKGAATYFGGAAGGKAAELATKSKAGDKVLNKGAEILNKMPGVGKATKKLDDSGAIDAVDKAIGAANKNAIPQAGGSSSEQDNPTAKSSEQTSPDEASPQSQSTPNIAGLNPFSKRKPGSSILDDDQNDKGEADLEGKAFGTAQIQKIIIIAIPLVLIVACFLFMFSGVFGTVGDYEDALGANEASGGETGEIEYSTSDKDAQEFYERVNNVKLRMQANGKSIDALKVSAVYHILNTEDASIDYETMTESKIEDIANSMLSGNSYNEATFKQNLKDDIFASYLPDTSESEREDLVEDVFDYIDRYYEFIGEGNSSSICASMGSCIYEIKGFEINGRNVTKDLNIADLKVRLMECGSPYGAGDYNTPIDQDLVSFEDYIAGVAYAEIGAESPDEAIKAQMIAARNFALSRPEAMGNGLGKKLEQEDGQWILQIASCVADQVFCNIDEGCSYMGGGDGQGGIVRSGKVAGALRTRDPLPADHKLRRLAKEVQGEVLVNNQGNVMHVGYASNTQYNFMDLANQGLNYKQILLQKYGSQGATDIEKMTCNSTGSNTCTNNAGTASTGSYASWKQYEGPWINITLGNSGQTIKQIGCLVTSVSMLIAKSEQPTTIDNFNPGTFVEFLNSNGGFVGGGNFVWGVATKAAPGFTYQGQISVSGYTKEQKLAKIKQLLDQGAYVVAEVKGNTGQHWVAIDSVSNNKVTMMDPGSSSTDLWTQYDWRNTSTLAYYTANNS